MKIIFRFLDFILLFLITVFIFGIFTLEDTTYLMLFIVLTVSLISYFILNYIYRIKLFRFIKIQKEELKKEELNLENKFDDIKDGRFKDLKEYKAYMGEKNLISLLNSDKIKGKKRIISNLVIGGKGNFTTEIDVILFHTGGIFVFESKNWVGDLTGKVEEREWKCEYSNGESISVLNPLIQNDTHIRALRDLLAYNNNRAYKSFVVFTNRIGKLNINKEKGKWINLCRQSELLVKLQKQIDYSKNILSELEVDDLADALESYMNSFPENKYLHRNKFHN